MANSRRLLVLVLLLCLLLCTASSQGPDDGKKNGKRKKSDKPRRNPFRITQKILWTVRWSMNPYLQGRVTLVMPETSPIRWKWETVEVAAFRDPVAVFYTNPQVALQHFLDYMDQRGVCWSENIRLMSWERDGDFVALPTTTDFHRDRRAFRFYRLTHFMIKPPLASFVVPREFLRRHARLPVTRESMGVIFARPLIGQDPHWVARWTIGMARELNVDCPAGSGSPMLVGPSYSVDGADDAVAGPSGLQAGPDDAVAGPSGLQAGPDDAVAGPSGLQAEPGTGQMDALRDTDEAGEIYYEVSRARAEASRAWAEVREARAEANRARAEADRARADASRYQAGSIMETDREWMIQWVQGLLSQADQCSYSSWDLDAASVAVPDLAPAPAPASAFIPEVPQFLPVLLPDPAPVVAPEPDPVFVPIVAGPAPAPDTDTDSEDELNQMANLPPLRNQRQKDGKGRRPGRPAITITPQFQDRLDRLQQAVDSATKAADKTRMEANSKVHALIKAKGLANLLTTAEEKGKAQDQAASEAKEKGLEIALAQAEALAKAKAAQMANQAERETQAATRKKARSQLTQAMRSKARAESRAQRKASLTEGKTQKKTKPRKAKPRKPKSQQAKSEEAKSEEAKSEEAKKRMAKNEMKMKRMEMTRARLEANAARWQEVREEQRNRARTRELQRLKAQAEVWAHENRVQALRRQRQLAAAKMRAQGQGEAQSEAHNDSESRTQVHEVLTHAHDDNSNQLETQIHHVNQFETELHHDSQEESQSLDYHQSQTQHDHDYHLPTYSEYQAQNQNDDQATVFVTAPEGTETSPAQTYEIAMMTVAHENAQWLREWIQLLLHHSGAGTCPISDTDSARPFSPSAGPSSSSEEDEKALLDDVVEFLADTANMSRDYLLVILNNGVDWLAEHYPDLIDVLVEFATASVTPGVCFGGGSSKMAKREVHERNNVTDTQQKVLCNKLLLGLAGEMWKSQNTGVKKHAHECQTLDDMRVSLLVGSHLGDGTWSRVSYSFDRGRGHYIEAAHTLSRGQCVETRIPLEKAYGSATVSVDKLDYFAIYDIISRDDLSDNYLFSGDSWHIQAKCANSSKALLFEKDMHIHIDAKHRGNFDTPSRIWTANLKAHDWKVYKQGQVKSLCNKGQKPWRAVIRQPQSARCSHFDGLTVRLTMGSGFVNFFDYAGTFDDLRFQIGRETLTLAKHPDKEAESLNEVDLVKAFGSRVVDMKEIRRFRLFPVEDERVNADRWKLEGIVLEGRCTGSSKTARYEEYRSVNRWFNRLGGAGEERELKGKIHWKKWKWSVSAADVLHHDPAEF
ncbi:hypothetical protein CDD80_1209 [Ophiocordyceps camponoti-rufipedis]|uniref:Uncharacterized protein n=1 Tax=Ophiocordyceps camponoti-rufipedis TaxID=2004952 RepID=A0A2C5Z711_9HYPO|nr:hypothetical protein CDD80_1209 [Ophiocordyceps camponoti-rufipedis]